MPSSRCEWTNCTSSRSNAKKNACKPHKECPVPIWTGSPIFSALTLLEACFHDCFLGRQALTELARSALSSSAFGPPTTSMS